MWESCVVTKSGAELLGRLSGAELTGAKFGLSTVPEASLALQTEVTAPGGNLGIEEFKLIEGGFSATVRITNKNVREEYTVKQLGLYAREKSGDETVLLAVTQDEIGNRIPPESEMPDFSLQFTIAVGVSNEAEITAIVDSNAFVSREQVEIIVSTEIEPITEQIEEHIKNKSNPHGVTKTQVGLGNVPNVATNDQTPTYTAASDLSELSSGEKLSAAFGKLAKAVKDLIAHIADNVRHVTAAERSAWNGKAAGNHTHDDRYYTESETDTKLAGKAASNHSHSAASASAAGFMSAADKQKLDGITAGANKYTHPTTSGNKHIPAGGSSGQILRWSADGTAVWGAYNNTTYGAASQSANGLMSAADKKKLDGIAASANNYAHPAYTARTGVPTANQTPAFGGTFSITQPVSDGSGHITAMNSRTVKIPNTVASKSSAGLMSPGDKAKLDGMSNIKVTNGTVTVMGTPNAGGYIAATETVELPFAADLVFIYYYSGSAILSPYSRSNSISSVAYSGGSSAVVTVTLSDNNKTLTFKTGFSIQGGTFGYTVFSIE